MLALKVFVFTLLVPGMMVFGFPTLVSDFTLVSAILAARGARLVAWLGLLAGALTYLRCAFDFAVSGLGTPAPVDPPKRLVVNGLYRYTRNPMYLGILAVVVAEAILAASPQLGLYAVSVITGFHLFVRFYEEPALTRRFGSEYRAYTEAVPRWGVRVEPYAAAEASAASF